MSEKFTIEDEHRPGIRTYRLLSGDRIIAREVSGEFVHLLASTGLLREALWAILYADQDNDIADELHTKATAAIDSTKAAAE